MGYNFGMKADGDSRIMGGSVGNMRHIISNALESSIISRRSAKAFFIYRRAIFPHRRLAPLENRISAQEPRTDAGYLGVTNHDNITMTA